MKAYQNLNITGSINLSGSFYAGNLNATASNAILATTASSVTTLNQPVIISGSFTVFTGSGIEFQVTNTGVKIGNQISDIHLVTGSLGVSGSAIITGSVNILGSLLVNGLPAGSGGGASVTISGSAPSGSVSSGSLWYNPTGSGLYIQTTSPTGSTYVLLNPTPVTITGSAPSGSKGSGSLWWNENDGNLYVQVTSPTGSTYVPATNTVAGGNYGATYVLGFTGSTWNVNHNLATRTPLVTVYSGSEVMIPASITSLDANNTRILFSGSVQGTAVLSTGIGNTTTNNAVSASFATTSSFATTASTTTLAYANVYLGGTWPTASSTDITISSVSGVGLTTSGNVITIQNAGVYMLSANCGIPNSNFAEYCWTNASNTLLSGISVGWSASPSGSSTTSPVTAAGIITLAAGAQLKFRTSIVSGVTAAQTPYYYNIQILQIR
jgi:hypothetical protein